MVAARDAPAGWRTASGAATRSSSAGSGAGTTSLLLPRIPLHMPLHAFGREGVAAVAGSAERRTSVSLRCIKFRVRCAPGAFYKLPLAVAAACWAATSAAASCAKVVPPADVELTAAAAVGVVWSEEEARRPVVVPLLILGHRMAVLEGRWSVSARHGCRAGRVAAGARLTTWRRSVAAVLVACWQLWW